jgi:hypothetical protein
MENKEMMNEILKEMERFRQKHEHESTGNPDWYIRVCQAIVAKAAGYNNRNEWSGPIFEQVMSERKAEGTWELKEGARIYYNGDCANIPGYGVIVKVREPNEYAPLRFDILMDDGREWPQIFENQFKPHTGRKFWLADEYRAYRNSEIARAAELLKKGA